MNDRPSFPFAALFGKKGKKERDAVRAFLARCEELFDLACSTGGHGNRDTRNCQPRIGCQTFVVSHGCLIIAKRRFLLLLLLWPFKNGAQIELLLPPTGFLLPPSSRRF